MPKAGNGWGETVATYRFFDNEGVDWRGILPPHWQQTQQRMGAEQIMLCLQDTTELDFNGQQARGLGPLTFEARRGMYVHPTYAVTPEQEPLRILDCWMWAGQKKDAAGNRGGPKEWRLLTNHAQRFVQQAAPLGARGRTAGRKHAAQDQHQTRPTRVQPAEAVAGVAPAGSV